MDTTISTENRNFLQSFARQKLFSILVKLDDAHLNIVEGDYEQSFGPADAPLRAALTIKDPRFYSRIALGGSIGAAESWVEGEWHSDDLTAVIRIFARSMALVEKVEGFSRWLRLPVDSLRQYFTRNTRQGSRTNIAAHYDLGNDMYELFLDSGMQYSAAIFSDQATTLAQAQTNKLAIICEKLALSADDHLIEIGTGWGELACFAASNYGCRVTTTTLSKAQYEVAKQKIAQRGLEDRVTLLLKDYRDLDGQYDKLVSIEMIEAVGHQFMPSYFQTLNRLLKPNGNMLIQAITIADQRYDSYRHNMDFIQRYIFPGGCLTSVYEMSKQLKQHTDMTVSQIDSYGQDYAETLRHWSDSFSRAGRTLTKLGYSEDFQRLWHFYFSYCRAGFLEGTINVIHFEAQKPGARVCRRGIGNN